LSRSTSYLLVKRLNQSFFIAASQTTTFLDVKTEISKALKGSISTKLIKLHSLVSGEEGKELPDAATLADHEVKNSDVIWATFAKGWESGGSGDDWETVDSVKS
jgi:SHS2 domain-containing protein